MCYSQRSSIISYVVAMLSSMFAFYTGQYILGGLILFYCQVQLSEAIIWNGIDNNDVNQNIRGTLYGKFALSCHNIGLSLGIILLAISKKKPLTIYTFIPLIISVLFTLAVFRLYLSGDTKPSYPLDSNCREERCQNPSNRLIWSYETSWYIYSALLTFVLCMIYIDNNKSKMFIMFILLGVTVILSLIQNKKAFSTLWCYNAAIAAPILVLGNYFLTKNTSYT